MANEPTVTAMMITGLPGRVDLAKNAVKSFLNQTWRRKELLIINHSIGMAHEYRVMDTNIFHDRLDESSRASSVRELMVKRPETLGDLRNMALDAAAGDLIAPWDDDDWSHPQRIEAMMNKRIDGYAVTVTSHVRYSIPRNTAYVYHNPGGCANILLYPKKNVRYASIDRGSDRKLYLNHFAERTVIWENRQEFPHIFLRFFHGRNIWDDLHIMRKYTSEKWHNEWVVLRGQDGAMNEREIHYLSSIAEEIYGFDIGDAPTRALGGIAFQRTTDNSSAERENSG